MVIRMIYYNPSDMEEALHDDEVEIEALKKDLQFEKNFNELEDLDGKIIPLLRKYNLKLEYLKNNPPDDTFMPKWHELQDLKPYPVNDY